MSAWEVFRSGALRQTSPFSEPRPSDALFDNNPGEVISRRMLENLNPPLSLAEASGSSA